MIDDLATAIKARYDSSAGAALRAITASGLWFTKAEQAFVSENIEYIVFTWVGSTPNDYMGSGTTSKYEKAEIRFDLYYGEKYGATTITNAVDLLQTLFDWCTLSITGFTHIAFERTGTASVEFVDDIWTATVNYMAWFDG